MTVFQTIAILLTFAAMGSYLNKRFVHLPTGIGLMLFALLISWIAMGFAKIGWIDLGPASDFVNGIDFSDILLHGMLSFLLFAGALHIDLTELKKYRMVVALLATVGVVIAACVTGGFVWKIARLLHFDLPFLYALIFGALISPTDPVAVLGILKDSPVSVGLRLKISSESLLNDGAGVVLFLILLGLISHPEAAAALDWIQITTLIIWQGGGSVVLGLALGGLAYIALSRIDDYKTEVLLTLALAAGGYCFAEGIHVSAPITMVIAGLVIGNHGRAFVMSDKTRTHLDMFWELLDDILNAVLFLLIGLEIVIVPMTYALMTMGVLAIIATLIGRFVSVSIPIHLMRSHIRFESGAIRLMTWGGLRGGISIAMALSLPPGPYKNILIGMTYLTVVFSVLCQGTTFDYIVRKVLKKQL